jgi:uncharacterized integral membrane protein (TIGR00697 family)
MYPAIYFLIEAAVVYGITAIVMYLSWRLGGDSVLLASSVATYLMLLTASQFLASKIMNIGYANLPAGTVTYSATVATLDVITLKYGRRLGYWVVRVAALLQLGLWAMAQLTIYAPSAPFWGLQSAYIAIVGESARIAVASVVAFFTAETLDVTLVSRILGNVFKRVGVSDPVSMTVDSLVFVPIAFLGVIPTPALLSTVLGLILGKLTLVPLTIGAVAMNRGTLKYAPLIRTA